MHESHPAVFNLCIHAMQKKKKKEDLQLTSSLVSIMYLHISDKLLAFLQASYADTNTDHNLCNLIHNQITGMSHIVKLIVQKHLQSRELPLRILLMNQLNELTKSTFNYPTDCSLTELDPCDLIT